MTHALLTILAYTSSTLRTLSIAFSCAHTALPTALPPSMRAPVALPALTELSLAYTAPTDAVFNEFFFRAPLVGLFPALKRLDLSGVKIRTYNAQPRICARLAEIAPDLTHLRLSTAMALAEIAPSPNPPRDAQSLFERLPPKMARVLIALDYRPNIEGHPDGQNGTWVCYPSPFPSQTPPYPPARYSLSFCSPCWRCRVFAVAGYDDRIVALESQGAFTAGKHTQNQLPVIWEELRTRCGVAWMDRMEEREGCWDESGAATKFKNAVRVRGHGT